MTTIDEHTDMPLTFTPRELGLMDGYHDGQSFGCGITWTKPEDDWKNEEYDQGVNDGQAWAAREGR
jgi:hypothetical protein